ncbi:MAG: nicotinate-nucleotide adenylyltransferase [Verrucomicrobiota bacterium]|nr:nicotinate-nucleotide adenylyltransferase [Verrucomicrobiota bacterium]
MKIGFLGGSFDPVHFGHLCAAQEACEQHELDRLIFVPAAQVPLKTEPARASGRDRLAMLQAAIEGNGLFSISDYELNKSGVSYTIDSVRHFRAQFAQDRLFWIIGGDQLAQLSRWKEIEQLARLIEFIVVDRPGHPAAAQPNIPGLRLHRCEGRLIDISSSELRERMRRHLPLDYFVPAKTLSYIREKNLYR